MSGAGIRLGDLAKELGLPLEGDPDVAITGVGPLGEARPGELSFLRSPQYAGQLATTRAAAVVTLAEIDVGALPALRSDDPSRDFYRAAAILVPSPAPPPGVSDAASVDPSAEIDPSASVGPGCVIGPGVRIGARSRLHSRVTLTDGVTIGSDCRLCAGVVITARATLGDRVVLQPGVVIGGEGFGYVGDGEGGLRAVHNIGSVVVEDEVEIGANTTVDRGTLGNTHIGRGSKIDNLVQIGHNCVLGERVIVIAQSGIAGSTTVGDGAVLMAQAGVVGHIEIGTGAFIGPQAGVHKSVGENERVGGSPQRSMADWAKESAALARLPELLKRVRRLERQRKPGSDE